MKKILYWSIMSIGTTCNLALVGLVIYGCIRFPLFASGMISVVVIAFIIVWYYVMLAVKP